jgi:6-phosphogluconolactonase (cycloisomerase 2 family)
MMKKANWAWAVLAAGATLLTGCNNFWQAPASSNTITTTTLSSGYFFVLDAATSEVISYNIVSGVLTKISAYPVPAAPIAIAVAPNKNFLYVSTLNGIFVYSISSGVLSLGNNTLDISPDPATAMAIDSTDSWLIEASGSTGNLYAIPISPSTGLLASATAQSQPVALTGATINQITIAPNNQFVFVAAGSNGTYAYSFTASSNGNPFASAAYDAIPVKNSSAGASLSVAVDSSNRLLYVGEVDAVSSGGGLRAFAIAASGTLTEISGSPFPSGGTGPYSILPKSTNDTVYVANWQGTSTGNITAFSISYTNSVYGLTQLASTATTGIRPMSIAEDSEENFVLVESAGGSPYFSAYIFDTTTSSKLDLAITDSTFTGSKLASEHY